MFVWIGFVVLGSPDIKQEIVERVSDLTGRDLNSAFAGVKREIVFYDADKSKSHEGDLYLPSGDGLKQAIVMIHGGSWRQGDRHELDRAAAFFAGKGFVVFNIETRLVGTGGGFPRDILDAREAFAYLVGNAAKYKIDTAKITYFGYSSGAHVALMAAYAPVTGIFAPDKNKSTVQASAVRPFAVAAISAPTDLNLNKKEVVANYLTAQGFKNDEHDLTIASPVSYARQGVRTIIIHGDGDHNVPYSEAVNLQKLLVQSGQIVRLVTVSGGDHFMMGGTKDAIWQQIVDFLKS